MCGSRVFYIVQELTFSIKDFFSKCDQLCRKLQKSLIENFFFFLVLEIMEKKNFISLYKASILKSFEIP